MSTTSSSGLDDESQVAIIGAGPAGLVLSHLLARAGVESVVLEHRSREHVERRVRAGVLEHGTVELLRRLDLASRLEREGLVHRGILLGLDGRRHRVALSDLTGGRAITVYGQQELVKDLIAARVSAGGPLLFEAECVELRGLDSARPVVVYRHGGRTRALGCDWIAGCDGSQGVSRDAVPPGALTVYRRDFPLAWLGVLAAVAPSTSELVYARSDRGFALHSLRSPEVSRLYLQVAPDEDLSRWPDDRIWEELAARLATDDGAFRLRRGPILEKTLAVHRSVVVEPMQYGRLLLAGDAAHTVPPTGAKGLNLAVADVCVLARALARWYERRDASLVEGYSETCLRRVWRVQQFSSWMTNLLHPRADADPYEDRLARAELEWVFRSEAAARSLAENYVGLPLD